MALVRNGRTVFQNPGKFSGSIGLQTGNFIKGGMRNRFIGGLDSTFGGYANGHLAPSSFILPVKSGSISAYTGAEIKVSQDTVTIIIGRPIDGSSSITVTSSPAQLDATFPMIGSGSVVLSVSSASLAAAVNASGSGSISIASSALLGGIFDLLASGALSVNSSSFLSALAWIEAQAGGATPLSPEGLAQSLLDNNDIETGYSLRESLRLILASLAGKLSGAPGTTITIRDVNDTIDRIVATVDASGNRTDVTKDVSDV